MNDVTLKLVYTNYSGGIRRLSHVLVVNQDGEAVGKLPVTEALTRAASHEPLTLTLSTYRFAEETVQG